MILKRIVKGNVFRIVMDIVIISNAILFIFVHNDDFALVLDLVFIAVYVTELSLLLFSKGVRNFYDTTWHK